MFQRKKRWRNKVLLIQKKSDKSKVILVWIFCHSHQTFDVGRQPGVGKSKR